MTSITLTPVASLRCMAVEERSGHFHTRTLFNTIAEISVDRVLFSVDYPYETMEQGAAWFDSSLLCANDAQKIGRDNARRIFSSITEIPVPRRPLDSDSARIQSVRSQRSDAR